MYQRPINDARRQGSPRAGGRYAPVVPHPLWDLLLARGDAAKPCIEAASGPSWDVTEAGAALGLPPASVLTLVYDRAAIGYRRAGESTPRLPRWQFNEAAGTLHPWVQPLIEAHGDGGWGLVDFVTVERTSLDGQSYLSLLNGGRVDEVIAAAHRANPD